jgi:hypothetical protein
MSDGDNVRYLQRKLPTAAGRDDVFIEPSDLRELVCMMMTNGGDSSLVFTPCPEGCVGWQITDPDDVDRLAVYLIQTACVMRGRSGPP